jgi:hypothetical protein
MNSSEEFLQMRLNDCRIRRLTENFQKIIVADEVESRKDRTFLLNDTRASVREEIDEGNELLREVRSMPFDSVRVGRALFSVDWPDLYVERRRQGEVLWRHPP